MKPSVFLLNRVYLPDEAATGQILAELAESLVNKGWDVTVITSQALGHSPASENLHGVRVERVAGVPFTRKSHWRRALSYVSLYPALFWRALTAGRADVIVTMTDPPLLLVLGSLLALLKGAKSVHWAQDLYPEVAETLAVIRPHGFAARCLRWLSTFCLRQHDRVVCIGRCMRERLGKRGIHHTQLALIPNWADTDRVQPLARMGNPFRQRVGLNGEPVIMYSGNFGMAHHFDAMIEAAAILALQCPEVTMLFVGNGPRLAEVQAQVERAALGNVRFLPFQPKEQLAESLSAADLHLACMQEDMYGLVVPSKVYGILAAGRPCVFLGPAESEVAQVVEEFECGAVLPENIDGHNLATTLVDWLQAPERLRLAGLSARRAAEKYGLASASAAFDRVLREVLGLRPVEVPDYLPEYVAEAKRSAASR